MLKYEVGITEINTQVRRLGYISAIVQILSQKTLNESVLLDRLQSWSVNHSDELRGHINSQGEIKPTRLKSGAKRYLELSVSLGFVGRVAGAVRCTRFGRVLLPYVGVKESENSFELSIAEKMYYLYWLLVKDQDRMMTVIDLISSFPGERLSILLSHFYQFYLRRLEARTAAESTRIASEIANVRQRVAQGWKSPQRYAENIVPPRLNWLLDIGVVELTSPRGITAHLTELGQRITANMPTFEGRELRHASIPWINSALLDEFSIVAKGCTRWRDLSEEKRREAIERAIYEAFRHLQSTPARKLSLRPLVLYIILYIAVEMNLIGNVDEIQRELDTFTKSPRSQFDVRFSHRENESYLILRGI